VNKYADKTTSRAEKLAAIAARVRGSASMCMRKHGFPGEAEARRRAAEITATGTPMRVYKCPHCFRFHLTSKPLRRDMRKENSHG
jgi:hypothetical protein